MLNFIEKKALDAATATKTSDPINVSGYKRIGIQVLASDISTGNGVFTVEATSDGTNWKALATLIDNVANSNAQQLTRVASKTLSANGSDFVYLDNFVAVKAIRVKVAVSTDGKYSAFVVASE